MFAGKQKLFAEHRRNKYGKQTLGNWVRRFLILVRKGQAAQRETFGPGYPADVQADIQVDVLTQKLSPHRWERRKKKFFLCGRP